MNFISNHIGLSRKKIDFHSTSYENILLLSSFCEEITDLI